MQTSNKTFDHCNETAYHYIETSYYYSLRRCYLTFYLYTLALYYYTQESFRYNIAPLFFTYCFMIFFLNSFIVLSLYLNRSHYVFFFIIVKHLINMMRHRTKILCHYTILFYILSLFPSLKVLCYQLTSLIVYILPLCIS